MAFNKSIVISEDMFQLFSPILYLSRMFCLMPLKWKKTGTKYIITNSKLYIVYSYITIALIIFGSIFALSRLYRFDAVHKIKLGTIMITYVTCCDVTVVILPILVGVLVTSLKIDRYIDFIDCLKQVDSLLQKHPPKRSKPFLIATATLLYTSVIVTFDLFKWLRILHGKERIYVLLAYYIPYYSCYYFSMVMKLVFWQLVNSIKIRIILLNENLTGESIGADSNKIGLVSVKNQKVFGAKAYITRKQLQDLVNAYQKLIEATKLVNDCYGLITLILILGCMLHLLITPYNLHSLILNQSDGNVIYIATQAIWMLGHVLRLLLIVEPCHGCSTESVNTSEIILRLLSSNNLNKDFQESLYVFAATLAQAKIEFRAFDMAQIHRGLLVTVAGAVTTYLVILFQFNQQQTH